MALDVKSTTPRIGYEPVRRRASRDGGGDNLDWFGLARTLWRRKLFLLGFVLIALGLTAAWVSRIPSAYEAQSLVMLNERETQVVDIPEVMPGVLPGEEGLQAQLLLIKSRNMAERLIDQLNLQMLPEFNPTLRAETPSLADWLDPVKLIPAAILDRLPKAWADTLMTATSPVEMTDLQQASLLRGEIIDNVLHNIQAEAANPSSVINLKFISVDPELARMGANTLAELYLTEQLETKQTASNRAREFLEQEIGRLRQEVGAAEAAIQDFRREHGLIERGDTQSAVQQQMSELTSQLVRVRAEREAGEAGVRQVESLLSSDVDIESAARLLDSPVLTTMLTREIEINREMAELSREYGERHPRMVNLRAELEALQERKRLEIQQIAQRERNEVQVLRRQEASLDASINQIRSQLAERNDFSIQLEALEREATSKRELLTTYLGRLQEISSQLKAQTPNARIISAAALPDEPTYPQRGLIFGIAFFGSLLMGSLMVFGLEGLDSTIRSSEQIEDLLGMPTLGMVPAITDLGRTGTPEDYVLDNPNSPFGEAMRSLRTAILLTSAGSAPKTIMLTSAIPGEGKTSIAMCLARINARAGRRTLMIDCDLRRPRLHELTGVANQVGLSDILVRHRDLDEVVLADDRSGAFFVTAGPAVPDPAAILASDRMHRLLKEVSGRYDLVILDSPPVLSVSDGRVLSQLVDKSIFLVHWGNTRRHDVMMGVKLLIESGADVAGLVLSRVNVKKHAAYGYRDSGYYYDDKYTKYYQAG